MRALAAQMRHKLNASLRAFACAGVLAGCATVPVQDEPPASPASPSAAESNPPRRHSALRADETSRAIAARLAGETAEPLAPPKPSGEAYYTCSMHPEIHQAGPGTCPKCGMALIKKEGAN